MKHFFKKAGQLLTGISAVLVLFAGRAMALDISPVTAAAQPPAKSRLVQSSATQTIEDQTEASQPSAEQPANDSQPSDGISALENPIRAGAEVARGNGMPAELVGIDGVFTKIVNTVLYIIGVVSVIMLIYGGLRYAISGGNSAKVTDAKNTILYAIIGLIISLLAYAIVNFVINAVGGPVPAS